MKNFLVVLFYLAGPIASVHSFLENVPPHPWLFTTQMQRLRPRPLRIIPRPLHWQDISKFIYWKHFLELECFEEICGQTHFKDRSGYKRPLDVIGHRQMPAFRNDGTGHRDRIPNFYKMRENQAEPQNKRKYSGNERIILWPPERNLTEKQADVSSTKQGLGRSRTPEAVSGNLKENPKESTAVKDFIHQRTEYRFPPNFLSRTPEAKDAVKNAGGFPEDRPQRTDPNDDPSPEVPGVTQSSTAMYFEDTPHSYRQRVSPGRIQPYEVEEIIEEKYLVDVDEDDKEDSFKSFGGKGASEMDTRKNEMAKTEMKKKTDPFQSVIDSSMNTILKGLISPMVKTAPPPGKDVLESVLPLEMPEKHYDWRQQTAEAARKFSKKLFKPDSRVVNSRGFNLNTEKEYLRSLLLTDSPKKPSATEDPLNIFYTGAFHSASGDDLEKKRMSVSEKIPELSPTGALKSFDLLRNLLANHYQPNFTPTERTITTTQKMVGNSESPTTHFFPPSPTFDFVFKSFEELLPATESTTTDSEDSGTIFNEADATLTTQDFPETVKHFPESDVDDVAETDHNFVEFSDHPISFDLLTTTHKLDPEKDEETIWKSSRRMNFGHQPSRTTAFSGNSGTGEAGQRRSDILITDNFADYIDDESNLSTLSYFEKLKQNNSLLSSDPHNLTSDAIIPLIPAVIHDLRNDKIPSEDIPMLSRVLGKYWSPILALSNFTNLDMLPLIKMKDENDLENVLQDFLPEDKTSTTVATTESEPKVRDDYSQSYDYMDEYKELYKDILGQEMGDKKRRFRPRRDAEDDLKTLEATREYFDSIEEEHGDEGSDYFFEDIIYDEVSEGEDASVFELMEVSDVQIDKET